jgi:hypothetical protein
MKWNEIEWVLLYSTHIHTLFTNLILLCHFVLWSNTKSEGMFDHVICVSGYVLFSQRRSQRWGYTYIMYVRMNSGRPSMLGFWTWVAGMSTLCSNHYTYMYVQINSGRPSMLGFRNLVAGWPTLCSNHYTYMYVWMNSARPSVSAGVLNLGRRGGITVL